MSVHNVMRQIEAANARGDVISALTVTNLSVTTLTGDVAGVLSTSLAGGDLISVGSSSAPIVDATAENFQTYYLSCSAATGTSRGNYTRLYLTGGAGGEAGRFFTTVSANAPTDTVNGAHVSLSFGASAGNVTGQGNATRNTLHVPNRTLTGTVSAVQGELNCDGANSDASNGACFRGVLAGNETGVGKLDDSSAILAIDGVTIGSGNMVATISDHAATHTIRIKINGTNYYLLATDSLT